MINFRKSFGGGQNGGRAGPVKMGLRDRGDAEEDCAGSGFAVSPGHGGWRGWLLMGAAHHGKQRDEGISISYFQYHYLSSMSDRMFFVNQASDINSQLLPQTFIRFQFIGAG